MTKTSLQPYPTVAQPKLELLSHKTTGLLSKVSFQKSSTATRPPATLLFGESYMIGLITSDNTDKKQTILSLFLN